MVEPINPQRGFPAGRPRRRDADRDGHVLRDEAIVGQGRLATDVGAAHHVIGDEEWVRADFVERRRQRVHATSQLVEAPGSRPARQLSAHVGRVDVPSEEKTRLKYRLIVHNLEQLRKFHTRIIPLLAYYCNGLMGHP